MVKAARAIGKAHGRKVGQTRVAWQERLRFLADGDVLALLGISAVLVALRAMYLLWWTPYTLAPDEAQYWHWLTHIDLAYVTKPALTTWLMGVSTWLLGDTMLGVRAFALLGQVAVPVLGFAIVRNCRTTGPRDLGGASRRAAWLVFVVLTTMPLIAAGGLIMSPDAVLLPLWLGATWAALAAQSRKLEVGSRKAWALWLVLGVLVGFGGLAKYTAVLFFPLLGVYLLLYRREVLWRPQVWVAGLVALALQAPTLYWNAMNGWEGLAHVLWQADGGGDDRHGGLLTLLEFLGGQILVLGPVGAGLMALGIGYWGLGIRRSLRSGNSDKQGMLLLWLSVPIVVGFVAMTLNAKVQPNWPVLGTVGAIVAAGALYGERKTGNGKRKIWLDGMVGLGLLVAAGLSAALHYTPALHYLKWLPVKMDPTKEMLGYGELGFITGLKLGTLDVPQVILTTRYQTAAELAFNVRTEDGRRAEVLYVNPGEKRMTEYERWDWPALDKDGRHTMVLYVNEKPELSPPVAARFNNCSPYGSAVVERHGEVYRRAWYWVCWDDRFAGK